MFEHRFFDNLVHNVRLHLSSNDLHVPLELESIIEDYICCNVPQSFCVGEAPQHQARYFSLSKIRDFTKIMAGIGISAARGVNEQSLVDQQEAERRGAICQSCPLNDRKRCTVCTGLAAFAKTLMGKRTTSYDGVLGTCAKCGCLTSVKIWIQLKVLRNTTQHQYPEHCWLHPNHISPAKTEMSDGTRGSGTIS
jgi:hypothetical protein